MRKLWIRSLALSLGLVVTGARGQDAAWRPPQGPPVSLGKPIAIATSTPAAPAPAGSAPAVTLGRPVAIARPATVDSKVQQVSFTPGGARDPLAPVARGSAPDQPARPMPVGPGGVELAGQPAYGMPMPNASGQGMPPPGLHTWRRSGDEVLTTTVSRNNSEAVAAPPPGSPTLVAPTPAPMGPMPPGYVPGPGMVTTPGGGLPPGMVVTTPGNSPFPAPTVISGPNGPGPIAQGGPACGSCGQPGCCQPSGCGQQGCCGSGGCCCAASSGAWGCGGGCCDGPQFILGAEFLMWWMKGDVTPPLVTVAEPGNIPATFLNGGGQVAYGGREVAKGVRPGGRLYGQYWFDDDHCWGVDASGFFLANGDEGNFERADSGTNATIGRPFFGVAPGFEGPNVEQVASPFLSGGVRVSRLSNLWGFDANVRRNLWCDGCFYVDVFAGYRQLGLDESLAIGEDLTSRTTGDRFQVRDRFATQNRFYGGQVGVDSAYRWGDFTFGLKGSVAVGTTQEFVQISGATLQNGMTLVNATGGSGGLLAQSGTNIGNYSRGVFSIASEVGMKVSYDIFDWLRVSGGYNFLYWTNVARPGEQVNLRVNQNYIPNNPPFPLAGPPEPSFRMNSSDVYAHGLSFGLEFRY